MNQNSVVQLALCLTLLSSMGADTLKPVTKPSLPSLTAAERNEGWTLMFDGESTAGWRGLGMEGFPTDAWEIRDGCLHCLGGKKTADLVAVTKHQNFDLTFEWMIPKLKGNSGVKYRVQEKKGDSNAFGCEYQCMYDPGVEGKDATGSLYDVLPPAGKKLHPAGMFNQSRIVVQANHVEHWLNGVKVVEFEFWDEAFKAAVAKSKFKNSAVWAKEALGSIALQDHHDEVYFRNIKIRELPAPH